MTRKIFRIKSVTAVLLTLSMSFLCIGLLEAAPVYYTFEGTITSINDDAGIISQAGISRGDRLVYVYEVDFALQGGKLYPDGTFHLYGDSIGYNSFYTRLVSGSLIDQRNGGVYENFEWIDGADVTWTEIPYSYLSGGSSNNPVTIIDLYTTPIVTWAIGHTSIQAQEGASDGVTGLWSFYNSTNMTLTKITSNRPPLVDAGLNQTITSQAQCNTTLTGTASDPDGDRLTYQWLKEDKTVLGSGSVVDGQAVLPLCNIPFGIGEHTLTFKVNDGQLDAFDTMILTIGNSAPTAAPTGGGTYSYGDSITFGGEVSDYDNDLLTYDWSVSTACNGAVQAASGSLPNTSVTLPPCVISSSSLGLGTHKVMLTVKDGVNDPVSNTVNVVVIDNTAPTLAPKPDKSILWPPNHKMVDISINANASDTGGPVTLSAAVTSNEPQNGLGDGDMAPDWTDPVITDGVITLQLRAERSGSGDGRIYTVTITATDASGNASTALVNILVPHDKGK